MKSDFVPEVIRKVLRSGFLSIQSQNRNMFEEMVHSVMYNATTLLQDF